MFAAVSVGKVGDCRRRKLTGATTRAEWQGHPSLIVGRNGPSSSFNGGDSMGQQGGSHRLSVKAVGLPFGATDGGVMANEAPEGYTGVNRGVCLLINVYTKRTRNEEGVESESFWTKGVGGGWCKDQWTRSRWVTASATNTVHC